MSAVKSISFDVQLTAINCGVCGGTYAINERFREQCWTEGKSWTCPYCKCGWGYSNDNENARLKKKVEELQANQARTLSRLNEEVSRSNHLAIQLKGTKTRLTNVKKRVANGVCPCCNRTFVNLQRHMHTKHPDYTHAS